jgi:hypothetical protein
MPLVAKRLDLPSLTAKACSKPLPKLALNSLSAINLQVILEEIVICFD